MFSDAGRMLCRNEAKSAGWNNIGSNVNKNIINGKIAKNKLKATLFARVVILSRIISL